MLCFVGILCFVVLKSPPLSLSLGLDKKSVKEAEFYPLSAFPMYSKFSARPIYVYLTDEQGKPLASDREFGVRTSVLKKIYDGELRKQAKAFGTAVSKLPQDGKRVAGDATLKVLRESLAPERVGERGGELRLREGVLTLENGEIKTADSEVGVLR